MPARNLTFTEITLSHASRKQSSRKQSSRKKSSRKQSSRKGPNVKVPGGAVTIRTASGETVQFRRKTQMRKPEKDLTEWQKRLRKANKDRLKEFTYKGRRYHGYVSKSGNSSLIVYTTKTSKAGYRRL